MWQIFNEDCYSLKHNDTNSVDCIITDPPYGINFQGNYWDKALPEKIIWDNLFKVLKPGGFMLVFSSIKLMHRLMVDVEDSGFIIKDVLFWVHLNGMPKNRNIALDIDKELGMQSHIVGEYKYQQGYKVDKPDSYKTNDVKFIKEPASSLANKYMGAGINLKPAYEPIIMFQKPIAEDNIAKNIIKYGTGALNMEECRIPYAKNEGKVGHNPHPVGRIPSNIIQHEAINAHYDKFFIIPKVRSRSDVLDHPTQKPIELMEHLVKLVSFENFLVLDPFMGSGSCGVACMLNNRNFMGYELDSQYFNIAKNKLNNLYNKKYQNNRQEQLSLLNN
jgi:site-specific DNA-methyltransferase (adenine-specific)